MSAVAPKKHHGSKRAPMACQYCHDRKVRCDLAISGSPCTNCRLDMVKCFKRFSTHKKPPRKRLQLQGVQPNLPSQDHSLQQTTNKGSSNLPFSYYSFVQFSRLGQIKECDVLLLESRGCLHLPSQSVLETFVRHYFLYVHPTLPILDETKFWHIFRQRHKVHERIPLVLLQAMLFAAAAFIPLEVANQYGSASLVDVRDSIFHKVTWLYSMNVDDDPVVMSQTALLLSYYNTHRDTKSNSTWLGIAIRHAQAGNADQYDILSFSDDRERLKRLWWSCILRDRMISLGTRRPLQILDPRLPSQKDFLFFDDLKEEPSGSEVYNSNTKMAINSLISWQCEFAVVVTDILAMLYPGSQSLRLRSLRIMDDQWSKLEQLKHDFSCWNDRFVSWAQCQGSLAHPSIKLFICSISIHSQTVRLALCTYTSRILSECEAVRSQKSRLKGYGTELQGGLFKMTEEVKELIDSRMSEYLPVSVMAFTALPMILWGISVAVSGESITQHQNAIKFSLFKQMSYIYSLRYDTMHLSAVVQRVVQLIKPALMTTVLGAKSDNMATSFLDILMRHPQTFSELCLYLDVLLSADDKTEAPYPLDPSRMTPIFGQIQRPMPGSSDVHAPTNSGLLEVKSSTANFNELGPLYPAFEHPLESWEEAENFNNGEEMGGVDHKYSGIPISTVESPPELPEPEEFGQFLTYFTHLGE
ncbi:hypothetical protein ABOM_011462 [Aspergillus bombycis]|uniref:Zn(2)-C6 fungal-type domain-containing protein n=1 Tax=Aspergillus bombycis TaxID=109264 RepID=A0A1F7ZKR9_9EURO|nr:hypothetical protein ABOM_011462 [Aspergillus bombycis]OGM39645.1 hypothetical protein ABOM_011462 [Aspergillus bombycis]